MNRLKSIVAAACLSAALGVVTSGSAGAETATPAPDKATVTKSTSTMSDADKRAKATDCSKQADAKKLTGTARKTFREECKKK